MRVGCGCRRPVKQGSFLGCDVGQEGGGREGGREDCWLPGGPGPGGWWCLVHSVAGWRKGGAGCGLPCPARHTL